MGRATYTELGTGERYHRWNTAVPVCDMIGVMVVIQVDLKCVSVGSGGHYYPEHLCTLGWFVCVYDCVVCHD